MSSDGGAAGFILLKDSNGYEYENPLKQTFKKLMGSPVTTTRILRGELVKECPSDPKYNYVLHRNSSIFLTCKDEHVAPLIKRKEFLMMEGIEKLHDRFTAFNKGQLEFGLNLRQGCKVHVAVFPSGYPRDLRATLHFIGEVKGLQGLQFGVEIREKQFGTTDGIYNGQRYFECPDGHGLFVSLDRLKVYPNESYPEHPQEHNKIEPRDYQRDGPASNTRSTTKGEGQTSQCHKGDRVFFFNKNGDRMEGVVQWAGFSSATRDFGFRVIGIETDQQVFNTDIESSLPGLAHLISAPKFRSLFLPEIFVEKMNSNNEMDIVVTPTLVKDLDCPTDKRIREQQKCLDEVQERMCEDELKLTGVLGGEEFNQQKEEKITRGSLIQIPNGSYNGNIYGVVKWIGSMPSVEGLIAGIELEEPMDGCCDGSWKGPHQQSWRLFTCDDDKGLFYPLNRLQHDQRGSSMSIAYKNSDNDHNTENSIHQAETVGLKSEIELKTKENNDLSASLQEKLSKIQQLSKELEQHKQALKRKDKEFEELQASHDKLATKLKKYEDLHDESWINESVPSWQVERAVVKRISQQHLGVGAWGIVNSGEYKGQKVAIKHTHKELLRVKGIVEMIKREISISAQIQHPNLVRMIGAVFDSDVEAKRDVPIILFELMDMNLRTGYEEEKFTHTTMVSIFSDVAYALHYLHEQVTPIIHRDVSAPNVLLQRLPNHMLRAKVSDFGSANLASQSRTAGAGALIYTPPEMFPQEDILVAPPEQTVKVDVYSYGIVLLEVVCREMPVIEKRHTLLPQCKSEWKDVYAIIRQCTKRKSEDRPTMREILKLIVQIKI